MSDPVHLQADRRYGRDHGWVLAEDASVRIGITQLAVHELGELTSVDLAVQPGDRIEAGESYGNVESVKTLSDLVAPISGTVVEVNERVEEAPELLHRSCWDDGWLVRVLPDDDSSELLSPDEYRQLVTTTR